MGGKSNAQELFPGIGPSEGMCSIPVVLFDVEHYLIDQLIWMPHTSFNCVSGENVEPDLHSVSQEAT